MANDRTGTTVTEMEKNGAPAPEWVVAFGLFILLFK